MGRRIFGGLALALVAGAAWWWLCAPLPPLAGRLALPGLAAPVEIVRDRDGIPRVRAHSEDDAWFALGVLHAQDRLWQIEMNRRIAAGRIAEVLGPAALPADRFLRTLGLRRRAEATLAHFAPGTRRVLEAYAAGVNAWLAQRTGPLPPEFVLSGVVPESWAPADSLGWVKVMSWDLSSNWSDELARLRLSARLSTAQIQQLLPPYPGEAPPRLPELAAWYRSLDARLGVLETLRIAALPAGGEGLGSNNWVVAGSRSASGQPLLANDPHLGLTAPSVWYLAQLEAPGLRVLGATLPGVPLVVIGRSERIAWGMTNTKPDTQDLYLEKLDGAGHYLAPEGWQPLAVRRETIGVKGAPDEVLEVRETRHGPLLPLDAALPEGYALALAWTTLADDDLTFQAGARLPRARDWAGFVEALRDFHSPQQNFVYADVDGHIGFIAPGRVPLRRPDNALKGLAPAPGWDARYDWTGFVPFEALPRRFDPPEGVLYSANEKIVADDYPYWLTSEWATPYRARRIRERLAATPRHTPESFAALQRDVRSLWATDMLPLLRAAEPPDAQAREWQTRLLAWDGEMVAERAEPLVYAAWMRAASRRIYADELGPLFAEFWEQRALFLYNVLRDADGQGRWCDDVATPEPESCARTAGLALADALAELRRDHGADPAGWRWGAAHVARAEHRPLSRVPWLAPLVEFAVPTPGDTYTVNVGRHYIEHEAEPYASRQAASLRMIVDFAAPEGSRWVLAGGQSGIRTSHHYADQLDRWARGGYLDMSMDEATWRLDAEGTLVLEPTR